MMYAVSSEVFDLSYTTFISEFSLNTTFINQFNNTWIERKDLWSKAWRKNATFNTNNLVESYHNQLKTNYLGRARSLRVDRLVYLLSQVLAVDYRQDNVRVLLGITSMSLSRDEQIKKQRALSVPMEEAVTWS